MICAELITKDEMSELMSISWAHGSPLDESQDDAGLVKSRRVDPSHPSIDQLHALLRKMQIALTCGDPDVMPNLIQSAIMVTDGLRSSRVQ